MGVVYVIGIFLFCISVWGVIHLSLLGFFFGIEASTLVEDVKPVNNYTDIIHYLEQIRDNYYAGSRNCYCAAYAYVVLIVISWMVTFLGRYLDKRSALRLWGEDRASMTSPRYTR